MSTTDQAARHRPSHGPYVWNGNEIVREAEPTTGIAGLAPDAPEEWGPLFAAAPDMYEVLEEFVGAFNGGEYEVGLWPLMDRAVSVLAKARGEA